MKKKPTTLRRRLAAILILFLVVQLGMLAVLVRQGGILSTTRDNAFSTIHSLVANRGFVLSNEMFARWGNLANYQDALSKRIGAELDAQGVTPAQLMGDSGLAQSILRDCSGDVIDLLRQNGVTAAYLFLDAPGNTASTASKAGFCVRDYDPQSYLANNTDLLLECGLPSMGQALDIPLDSGWTALFSPKEGDSAYDFYYHPLEHVRQFDLAQRLTENFSYWSPVVSFFGKDGLTCSSPVILSDGSVVGVMGVGIQKEYISSVLHYEELDAARQGAYVLAYTENGGGSYHPMVTTGPAYSAFFRDGDLLTPKKSLYEGYLCVSSTLDPSCSISVAIQPISLASEGSTPHDTHWVLMGLLEEDRLLAASIQLSQLMRIILLLSFIGGVVMALLAAKTITKPIIQLVDALHNYDPRQPIRLPATNLREIDALSSAIEAQNEAAINAAARNSQIIAMTDLPLGVFDYIQGTGQVFVNYQFFSVLGWPDTPEANTDSFIPYSRFRQWQALADEDYLFDKENRVYRLPVAGEDRFVQLFYRQEGERVLGVYLDVTRTMKEKQKIEYERDYDVLTSLLNRRAFDARVQALFQQPEKLKVSALIMFDLDNLKYTNDTFGHDAGDLYLQTFAHGLTTFYAYRSVVGRRSGDEFTAFLYGFDSKDEVREIINRIGQSLSRLSVSFSDSTPLRVRTSGGISWYPDHSTDYDELLRMADFAMYDIKHSIKGVMREFDPDEYSKHGIFIRGQDALNRLIDERLVRYAFQPIVSAKDGSLYGYELLMRPKIEELANLDDMFRLAQAQSKLYQLERLTWFESLAACAACGQTGELPPETHLFINSIGSCCLTAKDMDALERRFPHLLHRIVLELVERDVASTDFTALKRDLLHSWNGLLALDDYGSGFNSESMLMEAQPDIVKIDLSIIRNIDSDPDRQTLVRHLVFFAAQRGILVLAEGVETQSEMFTLLDLGVDYLQGFYIGIPEFRPQPIPGHIIRDIQARAGAGITPS